jgi:hypothetical protein
VFCSECGTQNPDTNQFCKNCGNPLKKRQPQAVPPQPAAAYQLVTPVYIPTAGGAQPQVTPAGTLPGQVLAPTASTKENVLTVAGIAGILAGILSWFIYPYICGIVAILLGIVVVGLSGNRKRKGVIIAVLGLIIGLASIIVDIFYFTLFPPQPITLIFFWLVH